MGSCASSRVAPSSVPKIVLHSGHEEKGQDYTLDQFRDGILLKDWIDNPELASKFKSRILEVYKLFAKFQSKGLNMVSIHLHASLAQLWKNFVAAHKQKEDEYKVGGFTKYDTFELLTLHGTSNESAVQILQNGYDMKKARSGPAIWSTQKLEMADGYAKNRFRENSETETVYTIVCNILYSIPKPSGSIFTVPEASLIVPFCVVYYTTSH
jgi:hypothetical protein